MTTAGHLRDVLLAAATTGQLLHTIKINLVGSPEERDELSLELAALHNDGLVDVVDAFENLKNDTTSGSDFFLTRNLFVKSLPHLNASVESIMRCVLSLCREAGQDLPAGTIFSSYIDFCAKDAERPREALKLIEAEPDVLAQMLAATIVAGSQFNNPYYLSEIIRLMHHPNIELRRNAVFSVSRIHWPSGASVPDSVIFALEAAVAEESDDRILAGAIQSAFALFEKDSTRTELIVEVIGVALDRGHEHTLHAASILLWGTIKTLPPALVQLLLSHLSRVNPENSVTLGSIDLGIAHLLAHDDPDPALILLAELLVRHDGKLNIKTFDSAVAQIRESSTLSSKVLTRWFLSGEQALCESVEEIVRMRHGEGCCIEIDGSELEPPDYVHILFTAREAIGYFFLKPVTAASVVISLMRHAPDDKTLDALWKLLFDPLLLNYPGGARDYVKRQAEHESGKIKESIENALASIEHYLENLRAVPELPALHPSQSQRESQRRRMSESMAKSMKDAEKGSAFFGLISRQTLLYGKRSISYIYAGDGEPRRTETPLTRHGYSIEFPRMDNIDPYSLNEMLQIFRLEQFQK